MSCIYRTGLFVTFIARDFSTIISLGNRRRRLGKRVRLDEIVLHQQNDSFSVGLGRRPRF